MLLRHGRKTTTVSEFISDVRFLILDDIWDWPVSVSGRLGTSSVWWGILGPIVAGSFSRPCCGLTPGGCANESRLLWHIVREVCLLILLNLVRALRRSRGHRFHYNLTRTSRS